MNTAPFNLYQNCIPVKGYNRSVIYDLQKGDYHLIPNSLYSIILKYKSDDLNTILKDFDEEEQKIIEDYRLFLSELGIVNTESDYGSFPPLNLEWDNPSIITNTIICVNGSINYDFQEVINQIDVLGCKAYQLRFFAYISEPDLSIFLNDFQNTQCQDLQVILPYNISYTNEVLKLLFQQNVRISGMLFHSSPRNSEFVIHEGLKLKVSFIQEKFRDNCFCGKINPLNFTQNIPFFTESMTYNNCLNRKLAIDENGYITNCPSLQKKYGHVRDNKILEVVSTPEYQKLWKITKDNVKVCQDCEFRYMCLDCRAYMESDIPNQPVNCGYNPYISLWKGQDGYITVSEYLNSISDE